MTDRLTPLEFIRKELNHHEYSQVNLDSRLEKDLGVDSLELLELVMAVENYYDIDFDDDELEEVVTVNDFCLLTEGKLT
jgi:acyl carrier protein